MTKWWGKINFELNELKSWRIGQRKIVVQRKEKEWLIWNDESKEESNDLLQLESFTNIDSLNDIPMQRFLVNKTQSTLLVQPALANRSVIVRPGSTLTILPGESAKFYVSTPLWLSFSIDDEHEPLCELPFWLPSDSWFGVSTMVGELCYAKYTDARVSLDSLKKRSHRAITTISIVNEDEEPLVITRINLAAPFLDLYIDSNNQFWTDNVWLIHNETNDRPSFEIKKLIAEKHKTEFEPVNNAREIADANTFMRSIRSLIA